MIRPTMSHAANKEELYKLMGDYATQLEEENSKLREELSANKAGNRSLSCLISDLQEERTNLREQLKKSEAERDALEHKIGLTILTTHEASLDSEVGKRFAIEQQIKALEYCLTENAMENDIIDASIVYVDDIKSDIEQLRKGLEK